MYLLELVLVQAVDHVSKSHLFFLLAAAPQLPAKGHGRCRNSRTVYSKSKQKNIYLFTNFQAVRRSRKLQEQKYAAENGERVYQPAITQNQFKYYPALEYEL